MCQAERNVSGKDGNIKQDKKDQPKYFGDRKLID